MVIFSQDKDDEACGRRRRKWGRNIGKHTKHGAIA